MPRDYGEIMCEAINTIVQESLKGLEYDITKNCTIVNIDDRKFGKYKVSDGSLTFFAYSPESAIYELDETVLVTIPQGDLNKQATIINRLANPLTNSINYVRPFDTLLKGTGNICYNLPSSKGIIANHNNKGSLSLICSIDKEYFGFTKLGLSGDFKTLISRMNVVEGAYGIKLMLYGTRDNKDSVMDLTFSSYDMFGNAYEFISYYN